MTKRGRPPGADSAATRERIIDVARIEFASSGFGSAAITTMASAADLAPSALYYYFGSKAVLYEAVFEATAEGIWSDIGQSSRGYKTLIESMRHLVGESQQLVSVRPHYSDFLAMVPMEARLRPEFAHLLDRRAKYQDETFGELAELGIRTGELVGFDQTTATEAIRSLLMGWFFERHFHGDKRQHSGEAILQVIEALGRPA